MNIFVLQYSTFSLTENFIIQYLWTTVSIQGVTQFQYTLAYLHARQKDCVQKIAEDWQLGKQDFHLFTRKLNIILL